MRLDQVYDVNYFVFLLYSSFLLYEETNLEF